MEQARTLSKSCFLAVLVASSRTESSTHRKSSFLIVTEATLIDSSSGSTRSTVADLDLPPTEVPGLVEVGTTMLATLCCTRSTLMCFCNLFF